MRDPTGTILSLMIAWPCVRVWIESQPMSLARYGASACDAKTAKNRLFESNYGTASASGKPSVAMQRRKGATS